MIQRQVGQLLEQAGISINGRRPWDIHVKDARWYSRVWMEKNLGLGESYMDGWWDCAQLDKMFERLLRAGIKEQVRGGFRYLIRAMPSVLFNLQTRMRSRRVAKHHYEMGNDLFAAFLDPWKQYSCAFFEGTDDLSRAQQNKLALISRKLNLIPEDHVLDIGCGWGGLAHYVAEHHGCHVTGVNISEMQLQYARRQCAGLPVTLLDCDYRSIQGKFDKIVSVGMFEHVGKKNYPTFMRVVHDCLKTDGIFLLHTIGGNISRASFDPWFEKYIFPHSLLPSIAQIAKSAEPYFVIEDLHNLGPHYAKTLMAWNSNFQSAWPSLQGKYDLRFKRMWEYYLQACAGAFRARDIQLWQIVMTRQGSGRAQPHCRDNPIPNAASKR